MKSYRLSKGTGAGAMQLSEGPDPVPGPTEVLVQVRATSLNYRDVMILNDFYPAPVPPGCILLSDGAGEVVAVGERVTQAKVGDRVAGTFFENWVGGPFRMAYGATQRGSFRDGMLAELRSIDEESLVQVPPHLSFEEAATLPCAALTAWSALHLGRGTTAGDTVLTLGTGGVSIFAVQFAKLMGCEVVATTSTEAKADFLRSLGADHVINYVETPDWGEKVRALTGGEGADFVVEVGGGATLGQSMRAGSVGAEIGIIGEIAGSAVDLSFSAFRNSIVSIRRITVGSRNDFEAMNRAISVGGLKPVIDRVFPFDEAREAVRYFEGRGHVGKVVISH